jgi:AraC-like DNA-binding protein
MGAVSRIAFAHAREGGIELAPILKKAGISRLQIEDPDSKVPARDQIRFLALIAEAMEDDFLGFHLGLTTELRDIGLLFYVVVSSATLVDALRRAARYAAILNEGVSVRCADCQNLVVSFDYAGVRRLGDRHQMEYWLTAVVRMCRILTGRRLIPERICVKHRGALSDEMFEFFGCPFEFGANTDEIEFSGDVKTLPSVSADPFLNKLLASYCEEALSRNARRRGNFRVSVENVVAPLLPYGKVQAEDVANRLGVSQRTLARRLANEGLTFSAFLDEIRTDLADRYLADHDLSISEISWLLGYREPASFSRAFKRWTGRRPREARSSANNRSQVRGS